jgi:FAD/FMN-containing dehydrogenase/Fe-S oxidoreductase
MTETIPSKPDARFRVPPAGSQKLDARRLARELAAVVDGEVRFSKGSRALYASTGSNYRLLPIGVVIPRSVEDVVAAVQVCRAFEAPIVNRGGGTSLAGQTVNVAVVLDFSKYLNRVLEIDAERRVARVQPGVILDHLRGQAEEHHLTYGPDPSTHNHCTLGGMIGNNSCGTHSVLAEFHGPGPLTADQVVELDVLTYRGERFRVGRDGAGLPERHAAELHALAARYGDRVRERYPQIPRRVSGFNLDRLLPEHGFNVAAALAGTESTCVTVLEATVELLHSPPARTLVVLGYESPERAGDHVMDVRAHKPLGLEGIDDVLIQDMTVTGLHEEDLSMLPEGRGFLLVELGGETKEEADARARDLIADAKRHKGLQGTKLYDDRAAEKHVWDVREAGLGATAFIPGKPDTYEGWEDSAVPPERVGDYIRELRALGKRFGYESALYGHYGQGCIHARWNFDLVTREGIRTFRRFLDEASDLVLGMGGSLSGEHGDGESRAELLPKMFGEDLVEGFREFKQVWDPDWKMNPGKVVDPYRITDNLKLGTDYAPAKVSTHFAYREDGGSFAHAATRCVGIGNCRRTEPEGGVMCPSFMATREEMHSTRGRAHLLWEMLNNADLSLWHDSEVDEALDLCLSCKGCTHDCPVHVDLPTLKAEYLAHRYRGRLRPRQAYAFGLIDRAARVAELAPEAVNLLARTPLFKLAAGMSLRRQVPPFAPLSLRAWFARRPVVNSTGSRVVLWPDTFNTYFHVETGVAAVEGLEAAGYRVVMPRGRVCCGRPLYDYGMLGRARRYLERTIDVLRDDLRAGVPVVGIEPSCLAVFRDELPKLLPDDEDGHRLCKQSFHFAEFLEREGVEPPPLDRHALLHGHCHHKATGGIDPEQKLLESMGIDVDVVDSGCCGMAGSWGYEAAHYDVSQACGEHALYPAVRAAPEGSLVVADGFSCKTQLEQGVGRRALHVAQVLKLARGGDPFERPRASRRRLAATAGIGLAAAAAIIAARTSSP